MKILCVFIFLSSCLIRAALPVLDMQQAEGASPYVVRVNGEPILHVVDSFTTSWVGYPISSGVNQIIIEPFADGAERAGPLPEFRFRYRGQTEGSLVDLDGLKGQFTVDQAVSKVTLGDAPVDLASARLNALKLIQALVAADPKAVDELFVDGGVSKLFPPVMFKKEGRHVDSVSSGDELGVVRGRYFILIYALRRGGHPGSNLLSVKYSGAEINIPSLLMVCDVSGRLHLYFDYHAISGRGMFAFKGSDGEAN